MNEITKIKQAEAGHADVREETKVFQNSGGMNAAQAAYMRGPVPPVAGSVPMSTSPYLNSPLFRSAFTTMSLRRLGRDVPCTYDIPDMSRGLADVTDHANGARLVADERARNEAFATWLDARKPIQFDLDRLGQLAEGTLGHAIHAFVTASGMEMKFVHQYEARNDLEFVIQQIGHSHDIQHLLTGYGPNLAGEHALAMMNCTAMPRFFSAELAHHLCLANYFVSSAMISRVFFNYPQGTPLMLEATRMGIEAGQQVNTPLFMVDFDKYLDWQMEDATRDLGFKRGPGSAWDYSEDLLGG